MRHFALTLALVLAACTAPEEARFLIEPAPSAQKLRVKVGSIEVRDVSLPTYAAEPDVLAEGDDGALYPVGASLWADDPVRGFTMALVSDLSDRTNATVAGEPWPLTETAHARLDVRVTQAFAGADGQFRLTGQFAVASPDEVIREFVRRFDIRVPLQGQDSAAIAAAQSSAIGELARLVSRALS